MDPEIISYLEMCRREGASLQKGMNFLAGRPHAVVLMSLRKGAPYADRIADDGRTLIYEGHDAPRNTVNGDPKEYDQPEQTVTGSLTENGLFLAAARDAKSQKQPPRLVRVYQKLKPGIWTYNGEFVLTNAWQERDAKRQVFKFQLEVLRAPSAVVRDAKFDHNRIIPTAVQIAVYKRDKGRCVKCGASDGLHFDHILAYSRGGSSVNESNIQLLCARHNLEKGARFD